MDFFRKITGGFFGGENKAPEEEKKEEPQAPNDNDPLERRRRILESFERRGLSESQVNDSSQGPLENKEAPKKSKETINNESKKEEKSSLEVKEEVPKKEEKENIEEIISKKNEEKNEPEETKGPEIREFQKNQEQKALDLIETKAEENKPKDAQSKGNEDEDLYSDPISSEPSANVDYLEPKAPKKAESPPVRPLSFVETILNITVDPSIARANPKVMYFPDLAKVLEGISENKTENQNVSFENADTCLFEILNTPDSLYFENSIMKLEYLESVYTRLANLSSKLQPKEQEDLDKMVTGYGLNLLLSPWMFGKSDIDKNLVNYFCKYCFRPPGESLFGQMQDFVCHTFKALDDEKDEERVILLLNILVTKDFFVDRNRIDRVLLRDQNRLTFFIEMFQSFKFIFKVFMKTEYSLGAEWIKGEMGPGSFQTRHFFMRYLRNTFFPWENAFTVGLYQNESIKNYKAITSNKTSDIHRMVYEPFLQLIQIYIQSGEEGTQQVLLWAEKVLALNKHRVRDQMMMGQTTLSDGEFFNFTYILSRLISERIPKEMSDVEIMRRVIDPFEVLRSQLLESFGTVDFNDPDGVKEWKKSEEEKKEQEQVNSERAFGSRLYVVASYANHLLGNIWKKYINMQKRLSQEIEKTGGNPRNLSPTAKGLVIQINSTEIQLLDPRFLEASAFMATLDILAITELVQSKRKDRSISSIGSVEEDPESLLFSLHGASDLQRELIPVYMLQSGTALVKHVRLVRIKMMASAVSLNAGPRGLQKLFKATSVLWLLCLGDKSWCRNPHVRADMMQTLSQFMPNNKMEMKRRHPHKVHLEELGRFFPRSLPYQKLSVQSLMTFFIDIEKTGSHNQFFEKFQYRYAFFLTLNYFLQVLPGFKERIQEQVARDQPAAMRFINLMLNDLIFLMDDAIAKIASIKATEQRIRENPNMMGLGQMQMELQRNSHLARSGLMFLYCYCEALLTFATCVPKLLLTPEIIDKFSANVNYVLVQFHGDEATEKLKLDPNTKKKISFRPEKITGSLARVLISMKEFPETYEGLIRDGRSFSLKIYSRTGSLFYKNSILKGEEIKNFETFFIELEKKFKENEKMEKTMDAAEVPEEFLDPIMSEIMKDPVLLPTSKNIVDRMTIMKHLLSDQTDPFNRQPLTEADLVPQNDLKERIDKFVEEIKKKHEKENRE